MHSRPPGREEGGAAAGQQVPGAKTKSFWRRPVGMVKIAKFMLCTFYHNQKKKKELNRPRTHS